MFDLVILRSIDDSFVFLASIITGFVRFIALPFVSSMVSFAARAVSPFFAETLLTAICDDDFNGFLLKMRGNPLIFTLFAAPNRHKNDLRGNVPPSLAATTAAVAVVTADAAGRAKPPGFGIRVSTDDDDVDEPLSNRGIFVCFKS